MEPSFPSNSSRVSRDSFESIPLSSPSNSQRLSVFDDLASVHSNTNLTDHIVVENPKSEVIDQIRNVGKRTLVGDENIEVEVEEIRSDENRAENTDEEFDEISSRGSHEEDELRGPEGKEEIDPPKPAVIAPVENIKDYDIGSKIVDKNSMQGQLSDAIEQLKKLAHEKKQDLTKFSIESHLAQSEGEFQFEAFSTEDSPATVQHRIGCEFIIKFEVNGQPTEIKLLRTITTGAKDPKQALVIATKYKDTVSELAMCNSVKNYKSDMFPDFNLLDAKQKADMMSSSNLYFNFTTNPKGEIIGLYSIMTFTNVNASLKCSQKPTDHGIDAEGRKAKHPKGKRRLAHQTVYQTEEKWLQRGAKINVKEKDKTSLYNSLYINKNYYGDEDAYDHYIHAVERQIEELREEIKTERENYKVEVKIGGWRRFVPFVNNTQLQFGQKFKSVSKKYLEMTSSPDYLAYQNAEQNHQAELQKIPKDVFDNLTNEKAKLKNLKACYQELLYTDAADAQEVIAKYRVVASTKEGIHAQIKESEMRIKSIYEKPELKQTLISKNEVSKAKEKLIGEPIELVDSVNLMREKLKQLDTLRDELKGVLKESSPLNFSFNSKLKGQISEISKLLKENIEFFKEYQKKAHFIASGYLSELKKS